SVGLASPAGGPVERGSRSVVPGDAQKHGCALVVTATSSASPVSDSADQPVPAPVRPVTNVLTLPTRPAPEPDPTPSTTTRFGARLRELRSDAGLSLSKTARLVPCNKGYLSRIERGVALPSDTVARGLDVLLDADGALVAMLAEERATRTARRAVRT